MEHFSTPDDGDRWPLPPVFAHRASEFINHLCNNDVHPASVRIWRFLHARKFVVTWGEVLINTSPQSNLTVVSYQHGASTTRQSTSTPRLLIHLVRFCRFLRLSATLDAGFPPRSRPAPLLPVFPLIDLGSASVLSDNAHCVRQRSTLAGGNLLPDGVARD